MDDQLYENNQRNRESNLASSSLVPVNHLPEIFRPVFSEYTYFNRIQSSVFNDVYKTDEPIVVSAPTGSGKTVIFELAILRLLNSLQGTDELHNVKIIYVSPMKALCEERFTEWHKKFSCVNLNCISVTGDNDTPMSSLSNQNLIITTPEKWDSLTRRWRQNRYFVKKIQLFLIDEVHLLGDERGPTLEAIVSRMKTIEDQICTGSKLRFVAVSATIPNVEDIAEWLGNKSTPAKYFCFDQETRPVKLTKIVNGYYYNPKASTPFKFDLMLNYKLQFLILQHSEGKPTLIFCSTRKSVEMTAKHLTQNLTIRLDQEQKDILRTATLKMEGANNNYAGLIHGIGCHHAGMLPENRRIIEDLFRNGHLPVLVTTSTLAMGVNLPAHLVIIKSTKYYADGEYRDYTETTLLQMIGRAGRPQFDRTASAIILTTSADKDKFEKMSSGSQPIESRLHKNLTEYINAEIVLQTITDVGVAMEWVSTTFLFIRAKKNPKHYGIPLGLTPEQLDRKMLDMCQIEINKLTKVGMVTMDQTVALVPTDMGALMAKYHLRFETMKLFKEISGTEILQQILSLISRCCEFSDLFLRVNDKKALNLLNKCKDRETIRFPLSGKIKTVDMKINCLIQAVFGCLQILEPSLQNEAQKIMRNGERISKCLSEYLENKTNCYSALHSSLILSQCFHSKIWENSPYVSKQLTGIGPVLSKNLVNAGKTSFKLIMAVNPRNLEMILHRKTPMGDNILEEIQHLPQYDLTVKADYIRPFVAKVNVLLKLINHENVRTKITAKENSFMTLLIGDSDNNILFYQKFTHTNMVENPEILITLNQEFRKQIVLNAHFISENWAGLDCNQELELFTNNLNKTSKKIPNAQKPKVKQTDRNIAETPRKKQHIDDYFKIVKSHLKHDLNQATAAKLGQENLESNISEIRKPLSPPKKSSIEREEILLLDSDSDDKIMEFIDENILLNSDFEDSEKQDEVPKEKMGNKNVQEQKEIVIIMNDNDSDEFDINEEDFVDGEFKPYQSNDLTDFVSTQLLHGNYDDYIEDNIISCKNIISDSNDQDNNNVKNNDFHTLYEEFINGEDFIDNEESLLAIMDEACKTSTSLAPKTSQGRSAINNHFLTKENNNKADICDTKSNCLMNDFDKEAYDDYILNEEHLLVNTDPHGVSEKHFSKNNNSIKSSKEGNSMKYENNNVFNEEKVDTDYTVVKEKYFSKNNSSLKPDKGDNSMNYENNDFFNEGNLLVNIDHTGISKKHCSKYNNFLNTAKEGNSINYENDKGFKLGPSNQDISNSNQSFIQLINKLVANENLSINKDDFPNSRLKSSCLKTTNLNNENSESNEEIKFNKLAQKQLQSPLRDYSSIHSKENCKIKVLSNIQLKNQGAFFKKEGGQVKAATFNEENDNATNKSFSNKENLFPNRFKSNEHYQQQLDKAEEAEHLFYNQENNCNPAKITSNFCRSQNNQEELITLSSKTLNRQTKQHLEPEILFNNDNKSYEDVYLRDKFYRSNKQFPLSNKIGPPFIKMSPKVTESVYRQKSKRSLTPGSPGHYLQYQDWNEKSHDEEIKEYMNNHVIYRLSSKNVNPATCNFLSPSRSYNNFQESAAFSRNPEQFYQKNAQYLFECSKNPFPTLPLNSSPHSQSLRNNTNFQRFGNVDQTRMGIYDEDYSTREFQCFPPKICENNLGDRISSRQFLEDSRSFQNNFDRQEMYSYRRHCNDIKNRFSPGRFDDDFENKWHLSKKYESISPPYSQKFLKNHSRINDRNVCNSGNFNYVSPSHSLSPTINDKQIFNNFNQSPKQVSPENFTPKKRKIEEENKPCQEQTGQSKSAKYDFLYYTIGNKRIAKSAMDFERSLLSLCPDQRKEKLIEGLTIFSAPQKKQIKSDASDGNSLSSKKISWSSPLETSTGKNISPNAKPKCRFTTSGNLDLSFDNKKGITGSQKPTTTNRGRSFSKNFPLKGKAAVKFQVADEQSSCLESSEVNDKVAKEVEKSRINLENMLSQSYKNRDFNSKNSKFQIKDCHSYVQNNLKHTNIKQEIHESNEVDEITDNGRNYFSFEENPQAPNFIYNQPQDFSSIRLEQDFTNSLDQVFNNNQFNGYDEAYMIPNTNYRGRDLRKERNENSNTSPFNYRNFYKPENNY